MSSPELQKDKTALSTELMTFLKTPFTAIPAAKPLDFDALIGGHLSEEARTLLKVATTQRNKLLDVLKDPKADSRNVISAVDAYLPSIWRVTASMQASSQSPIKLNKKLEFKWMSSLNKKGKEFTGHVFLYETAFVLTIRAIYHRDSAKIVLEGGGEYHQDMGKELRTGAGIFEFVGKDLLARWQSPPEHRAPEVISLIHFCFAALYLADAQRVAISKAFNGSTNPTLLAKLLIGCAEKYEFATRNLQQVDKETFEAMPPGLLEELGAYPAILRACAANCMAQAHWAKGEYGKGLGFAVDGARRLQVITMGKGLQTSPMQAALTSAIGRALALEKEYQNDCDNVYFEKPSKELRMVDGTFIINSIPYELPAAELVSFAEVPLPASQLKMGIQNFWTALWAKPQDYPESNQAHVEAASSMSGASQLPGVHELAASLASTTLAAPDGIDPSVFASLPEDIQKEIANDAAKGKNVSL